MPKWLLDGRSGLPMDTLNLTVVELDPAMTRVARQYFALQDSPHMRIRHGDARVFLNRPPQRYDLIFVDVFNSWYTIPFHMGTQEAARQLRRALTPDGAVIMNVISAVEGPDGRLFRSIYHALKGAFAQVRILCTDSPARAAQRQNLILLAFADAEPRPLRQPPQAATALPDMAECTAMLAKEYTSPVPADVPPLRDDFAPVERYALMLLRP